MSKKSGKINSPILRDDELSNSGVGKILLEENKVLKQEIGALKKSLKLNQNELENLRAANHELDKQKSILDYRLNTSVLPELLKFLASAVCAGLAINFFFTNHFYLGTIFLSGAIIIYSGILFLYRR